MNSTFVKKGFAGNHIDFDISSTAKALRKRFHNGMANHYQRKAKKLVARAFVLGDKNAKSHYNDLCNKAYGHYCKATSGD